MNLEYIEFLEGKSGINKRFFPIDIYFPTEKDISMEDSDQIKQDVNIVTKIQIDAINYSGSQRFVPYSPISLIVDPNYIITHE